ncbi:MAG TPA: type VI secretion system tube protein Hcp [Luteibacter sp.]|uniref:Hcp family type VI secretion system effector n=1 Tax=Luteibacter sp. TaxID=1886636 RepID=UPI002B5E1578|nr:type VI secretion system tube protein Hcp [Luteibacter sp.]HVI54921.1 type VI secretion system tube protein Hcp [Luteibacter sp.]
MKSIYLKLCGPDLNGESLDKDHGQWIELKSLRHEMHQPTSPVVSTAGGHATQRAEHGDISLFKELDSASPMLYQYLSGGTTFRSAQIDLYRDAGDGKRVKYLEIQLKNVLISQIFLDVGEASLPTEMMSLRYAAIQWRYQKQNIDGGQGGMTLGAWSLTKNDKTYTV